MDWIAPLIEVAGVGLRDGVMSKHKEWPWWRRLLAALLLIPLTLLAAFAVVAIGVFIFGMVSGALT